MKKIVLLGLVFVGAVAFSLFSKTHKVSTNNILALSIQQNFCKLHRNKKECKNFRQKEFAFTLHGLWPQPKSKKFCKGNKNNRVETNLFNELKQLMPGVKSGLHKHEWKKHGTCYGVDIDSYFKDAIKVQKEINQTPIRKFFVKNQGKTITKEQLNRVFSYPRKFSMICKKGLVTELRFALKGDIKNTDLNSLLKDAKPLRGGCKRGKIAGF